MSLRDRLRAYTAGTPSSGLPTGLISFDIMLGGLPRGKLTELTDGSGLGKTLFALQVLAQTTRTGGIGVLLDLETRLSTDLLKRFGVDLDRCLIIRPCGGRDALSALDQALSMLCPDLVIIDSVAAVAEETEEITGPHRHAVFWQEMLPRLQSRALQCRTAILLLNQERQAFGQARPTGGYALPRYIGLELTLTPVRALWESERRVGSMVRLQALRSDQPLDPITLDYRVYWQEGYCVAADLIVTGVKQGVLTKHGSHVYYGERLLGQGLEQTRCVIRGETTLAREIYSQIISPGKMEQG